MASKIDAGQDGSNKHNRTILLNYKEIFYFFRIKSPNRRISDTPQKQDLWIPKTEKQDPMLPISDGKDHLFAVVLVRTVSAKYKMADNSHFHITPLF